MPLVWRDGPASSPATLVIGGFPDVPSSSVSEKGSDKTRISNTVHEEEFDGPEGAGRGSPSPISISPDHLLSE